MMVRHEFLFISGDPALDFVNTEIVLDGEPVDLLDEHDALPRWMAEAGCSTPAQARRAIADERGLTKDIYALRAALRDIVGSLADCRPVRRTSVAVIDAQLRRGKGSLALGSDLSLVFSPVPEVAFHPRFLLARAAAEFLSEADPQRIRRCAGTNCVLFFYDQTKSGTRRWCSMAGCGNRMKAALHYRRSRS